MGSNDETARDTLLMLEERLRRVDFLLNGDNYKRSESTTTKDLTSAALRLRALERSLHSLASNSPAIAAILSLHDKHPNIFHSSPTTDAPPTLPPSSLASVILAHSDLYTSTSTRLAQLQDTSILDPDATTKLITLAPRIEAARAKQAAQTREVAELRARSARVVERWYEGGVLGMDGLWADWEERLRDAEILVRRKEAGKKREEGVV